MLMLPNVVCWCVLLIAGGAEISASVDVVPRVDESVIRQLLEEQSADWNRGDIRGFMEAYWNSPEMTFSGQGQVVRGWQSTLERYQTKYPREKMGQLEFRDIEVRLIGDTAALVLGSYHLQRGEQQDTGGFTLVLEKFPAEGWRIIHDHTSAKPPQTP